MNRRTFLRRAAVVPLVAAIPAAAALATLAPKSEPQAYATASVDGEIKLSAVVDIPRDGQWHEVTFTSRLRNTSSVDVDYVSVLRAPYIRFDA